MSQAELHGLWDFLSFLASTSFSLSLFSFFLFLSSLYFFFHFISIFFPSLLFDTLLRLDMGYWIAVYLPHIHGQYGIDTPVVYVLTCIHILWMLLCPSNSVLCVVVDKVPGDRSPFHYIDTRMDVMWCVCGVWREHCRTAACVRVCVCVRARNICTLYSYNAFHFIPCTHHTSIKTMDFSGGVQESVVRVLVSFFSSFLFLDGICTAIHEKRIENSETGMPCKSGRRWQCCQAPSRSFDNNIHWTIPFPVDIDRIRLFIVHEFLYSIIMFWIKSSVRFMEGFA